MYPSGAAGLIVSINRILTKALVHDMHTSTIMFFVIGVVCVAICFVVFQVSRRTEFARYHVSRCRSAGVSDDQRAITLHMSVPEEVSLVSPANFLLFLSQIKANSSVYECNVVVISNYYYGSCWTNCLQIHCYPTSVLAIFLVGHLYYYRSRMQICLHASVLTIGRKSPRALPILQRSPRNVSTYRSCQSATFGPLTFCVYPLLLRQKIIEKTTML